MKQQPIIQKTEYDYQEEIQALQQQLTRTQDLLRNTELRLCETDIEKVQYQMKYLSSERTNNHWKEYAQACKDSLDLILNSKFWKLRSLLLAPFHLFRKTPDAPAPLELNNISNAPIEGISPLPPLPEDQSWESSFHEEPRIAIQVHAFYPDLMCEICDLLAAMPVPYDLYVTTTESYKATYINAYLKEHCTARSFVIDVVENKGRDVIPFLKQLQPVISKYDYFCHLHTKRSLHIGIGDQWRKYLLDNLIGSNLQVRQILHAFESEPKLGIVCPEIPPSRIRFMYLGENRAPATELMSVMGYESSSLPENLMYPAGTMFWARSKAVMDFFTVDYGALNIPDENGQLDATLMHAIERLWIYVAQLNGYTYRMFKNVSEIKDFET